MALPPAFDAWFARATARSAGDRFEGASTLVHELALALGVSAPGLASSPIIASAPGALEPSLASPTLRLAEPTRTAELVSAPEPLVSEQTTGIVSSRSIGSISTRSRLPLIVVASIGALGLAGLCLLQGVQSHAPTPTKSLAATAPTAADTPTVAMSAPDPAPASTPSVTPAKASSAPLRPTPAPYKPGTSTQGCNPPYVLNSSGHRIMKPQCL